MTIEEQNKGIINREDLKENAKSGLFVDQQLACDSLCWTLYAQPISKQSETGEVLQCAGGHSFDVILLRGLITENDKQSADFSVIHHFTPIGSIAGISDVLGLADSFAKGIKAGRVAVDSVLSGINGIIPDDASIEVLGKTINKQSAIKYAEGLESSGKEWLNKNLNGAYDLADNLTRGSLMNGVGAAKYYENSDITIDTPNIEFRYYHGMYRKSNGHEVSVRELIQMLNNRLIGHYYGTNAKGDTLGVLGAPNGILSTGIDLVNRDENKPIDGTFCLEYAGRRIPNLICTDYHVKLSNTKLLDYDEESLLFGAEVGSLSSGGRWSKDFGKKIDPLYADISIKLEPVTIYTRENINQIMAI